MLGGYFVGLPRLVCLNLFYAIFHICHLHVFFECQLDADVVTSLYCSLESIHAALAIMAHDDMPKRIYNEEVMSCNSFFI